MRRGLWRPSFYSFPDLPDLPHGRLDTPWLVAQEICKSCWQSRRLLFFLSPPGRSRSAPRCHLLKPHHRLLPVGVFVMNKSTMARASRAQRGRTKWQSRPSLTTVLGGGSVSVVIAFWFLFIATLQQWPCMTFPQHFPLWLVMCNSSSKP